jgi:transposase
MSGCQGVLLEVEDSGSFSQPEIGKRHVRQKLVYRRKIDPKLQIFDYSLEIPEDHPVRRLVAFIGSMDLSFLDALYSDRGGVPYDPRDCIGPILYGRKDGILSGEGLARACKYDARYRYAANGQTPDGRTFQRVLRRFGPELNTMHGAVLKRGRRAKRVSGAEVAVDGTKIAGNASAWKPRDAGLPSDPDVRAMESHGRKCLGYNVQIAVDTTHPDGLILGCEVIQAQNDRHAMPAIIEAVKDQFGQMPAQVLADTGYESSQSIQYLEEHGIESLICPSEKIHESLKENADGVLVCPVGKPLIYLRTGSTFDKRAGKDRLYDVYRPEGGCAGCPLYKNCGFAGKKLEVQSGSDPGARFRNRDRVESQGRAGAMMRRRHVERPFAHMKRHTRFDRFLTRGLASVRAELLLWVISYNIFKLIKHAGTFFRTIFAAIERKSTRVSTSFCIGGSRANGYAPSAHTLR